MQGGILRSPGIKNIYTYTNILVYVYVYTSYIHIYIYIIYISVYIYIYRCICICLSLSADTDVQASPGCWIGEGVGSPFPVLEAHLVALGSKIVHHGSF